MLVENMRLAKLLLIQFGGIGIASMFEAVMANPHHHATTKNRWHRMLTLGDGDSTSTLPRALGLSAINIAPKKEKSKGKGSNKKGKSKGSNNEGDDDDSHLGKGGAPPTYPPTWEDMPPDVPIEHSDPKTPKKSKKPKHESKKDKGAKLEKSTKGLPTYKPIPAPSAESK
jgi:hypothetical protein